MTQQVSSYTLDAWQAPSGTGVPVLDASTGDEVAQVFSSSTDMADVVRHAREVGGPALRALTFHQRAALLDKLAKHLTEHASELHELSATAGGTLMDARIDVDGGIGVLSEYVRRARRELPDDTKYVEGAPERLGRAGTVLGQTVYTSRHGVAVMINAFNFPVWGMLEKLAPALMAGLPVIARPATATAHIAERAFREIVNAGVLPAGAAQFIVGDVGDLLDHLDGRDYLGFTGSAQTAALLRSHPAVTERSMQINVEADSVNAAILGPDADPDTEEFGLYVKTVVRELTSKSGQKCTAIRRCLVPEPLVSPVVDALRKRLDSVVVGDPRVDGTTMGPVVSEHQRGEVESATRQLLKAADPVIGGPDAAFKPASGDAERGAFVAPTVLLARDPRAPELHNVEAFGPVTTVIGYRDAADAAELTTLADGSLVASVTSHDPQFVDTVVASIAPGHGRLLVLDRVDAREAAPHGAVLPALIHGGPGRAGGGEELGGIRGVLRLMQATSIAAPPAALVEVTGQWNSYAPQFDSDVHPFRKHFEDLRLGDTLITGTRTITLEDIEAFAALTGDTFYAHTDEEAAAANPFFNGRVAHGYFVISAAAGLFVDPAPGPVLANFGMERLRFVKPVYPGDTIKVRLTCKAKTPRDPGYGEVRWDVAVTNQNDELAATYELLTMNATRSSAV